MSEPRTPDESESTAERAGIVDQQDAALEAMEAADTDEAPAAPPDESEPAEPGGDVDPMEGPAPTG